MAGRRLPRPGPSRLRRLAPGCLEHGKEDQQASDGESSHPIDGHTSCMGDHALAVLPKIRHLGLAGGVTLISAVLAHIQHLRAVRCRARPSHVHVWPRLWPLQERL